RLNSVIHLVENGADSASILSGQVGCQILVLGTQRLPARIRDVVHMHSRSYKCRHGLVSWVPASRNTVHFKGGEDPTLRVRVVSPGGLDPLGPGLNPPQEAKPAAACLLLGSQRRIILACIVVCPELMVPFPVEQDEGLVRILIDQVAGQPKNP